MSLHRSGGNTLSLVPWKDVYNKSNRKKEEGAYT